MPVTIAQITIDDSSDKTVTGTWSFDRDGGGIIIPPSGTSFPSSSVAGEWFWRTDEDRLYRRDATNTSWETVTAEATLHSSTHSPGATDALSTASAVANQPGSSSAEGNATSFARSNHTHALYGFGIPAANPPGSSNTEGSATSFARSDHLHALAAFGSPVGNPPGSVNTDGSASTFARSDHKHALAAFGSAVDTFCQGNDARLSDDRIAHSLRTETTVVVISSAAAPTARQILKASSSTAAAWASPFGDDYQVAESVARSTTTSATFLDKTTLTTPALTGYYRIGWVAGVDVGAANKSVQSRLYNVTDAAALCATRSNRPSATTNVEVVSGFAEVTFTGAAKTFKIQFASLDGLTTVGIQCARIEFWRIS